MSMIQECSSSMARWTSGPSRTQAHTARNRSTLAGALHGTQRCGEAGRLPVARPRRGRRRDLPPLYARTRTRKQTHERRLQVKAGSHKERTRFVELVVSETRRGLAAAHSDAQHCTPHVRPGEHEALQSNSTRHRGGMRTALGDRADAVDLDGLREGDNELLREHARRRPERLLVAAPIHNRLLSLSHTKQPRLTRQ